MNKSSTIKKRKPTSTVIFTSRSIKIKVKLVLITVICSLIVGGGVHFIDSVNYNNSLTQVYNQKANYRTQLNETFKDYTFLLNQFKNSLNCYQILTNKDQALCNQHNTTSP